MDRTAVLARIAARTVREGECIVGTWRPNTSGYCQMKVDGRAVLLHRLVWELANGPIPEAMLVCHACDNTRCCRLDHLWLGTNADNLRDMALKRRHTMQQRVQCPAGHPYDEANTYWWRGRRHCRGCRAGIEKRRVRSRTRVRA